MHDGAGVHLTFVRVKCTLGCFFCWSYVAYAFVLGLRMWLMPTWLACVCGMCRWYSVVVMS